MSTNTNTVTATHLQQQREKLRHCIVTIILTLPIQAASWSHNPRLTWMITGASSPTMCSPSSLPAPASHSSLKTSHLDTSAALTTHVQRTEKKTMKKKK
jgi:hypothetical protein